MSRIINNRDLDLSFTRHPFTNDVNQFVESDSIKRSLRNLLSFKKYEKPFHPEISSGIFDSLFENFSPLFADAAKTLVKNLIEKYEPRVNLYDVVFLPNIDANRISLTLIYTIANSTTPVNFTFSIARNR
jgi:phage baseplate assembly protein W